MLDKAIEHGREHRKQYTGSKAFDYTCRNHGSCGWCQDNRHHRNIKRKQAIEAAIKDFKEEELDDWESLF